jgi:nucleoside-diphosphate-sugar epimerase
MKQCFLVTGATGFVGSSIAAQALSQGIRVAALSRRDIDGSRTREAIHQAAVGMGLLENPKLLAVYGLNEAGVRCAVDSFENGTELSFWHCAAEMTYSYREMRKSLEFNVSKGLELLELVHALGLARFYFFSTAFTTNDSGEIREELHLSNSPSNAYQASKWLAENLLSYRAKELGQPLTILRPGVIIGHSQTGWSTGKPFGAFMFLKAMHDLAAMGIVKVKLDIDPLNQAQLLTIDQVTDWSLLISKSKQKKLEVIHFVNSELDESTMEVIAASYSRHSGVELSFGKPVSISDAIFERHIQKNKEFAGREWDFSDDSLRSFGIESRRVTQKSIDRSIEYFSRQYLEQGGRKASRIYSMILRNRSLPKTDLIMGLVTRLGRARGN